MGWHGVARKNLELNRINCIGWDGRSKGTSVWREVK